MSAVTFQEPRVDDTIQRLLYKLAKTTYDALTPPTPPSTSCGPLSGAGSPVGATVPEFIGQLYHDTVADTYYRSTGLTNVDWVLIAGGAAVPFVEWLPHTEIATWNDSGGIGQVGDYTAFLATADLSSLSLINLTGTAITSLVCNNCLALTRIECNNCTGPLTTVDVSGCLALNYLSCIINAITGLDVSDCHALVTLLCDYNSLTSLNVTGCTALNRLSCSYNSLVALDITTCTFLSSLDCSNNSIAMLDLTNSSVLTVCVANVNSLTSLNFSTCPLLQNVTCSNNSLTSLNVTGCTVLFGLTALYNSLTSVDISTCLALNGIGLSYNNLTVLSVNTILSDTVISNPPVGAIGLQYQTPLAPPDAGPPDGVTAKATLIGLGWTVFTD